MEPALPDFCFPRGNGARVAQVDARAIEFPRRPSWRTGACNMVMKVRKTVLDPAWVRVRMCVCVCVCVLGGVCVEGVCLGMCARGEDVCDWVCVCVR